MPSPSTLSTTRLDRRTFLAAASTAASVGLLTSCSSSKQTSPSSTLNVWSGTPAESGPGDVIAAFKKVHPDVTVNFTQFTNDERGNLKVSTALTGGADIDVYFSYNPGDVGMRADSGLAADLTDLVRQDTKLSSFADKGNPKGYWHDTRLYSLASGATPELVFINLDRLNRAGITIPRTWTLDEFVDVATELTHGDSYGVYQLPDRGRIVYGPTCWYKSDGQSNLDNSVFERNLAANRKLIEAGVCYPWTEVLSRNLASYQQNYFIQGGFALWVVGTWALRYMADSDNYPHDFRVGLAPLPVMPEGGGWNTGSYGDQIMINPASKKQALAWEFARFWILEGSKFMVRGGKIPSVNNMTTSSKLKSLLGKDPDRWYDSDSVRWSMFDHAPKIGIEKNLTAYAEIDQSYKQQRDLCWIGEKSPQQAAHTVDRQARSAISRAEVANS